MTIAGALRFARFAVPPNQRGYCGPDRAGELAAYRAGELVADQGLVELARGFEGAWPYLELLAGVAGTDDPLDDRVVEAYWIGNELCRQVQTNDLGLHLVDRFGARAGRDAVRVTAAVGHGAAPHHAFHVLGVYPWVGLLREGRGGSEPLRIIRQCHISWGRVIARHGDELIVDGPTLQWDGMQLGLGPPAPRNVWLDPRLTVLAERTGVGRCVAIHWGQVVDALDERQRWWLEATTWAQIAAANHAGVSGLVGCDNDRHRGKENQQEQQAMKVAQHRASTQRPGPARLSRTPGTAAATSCSEPSAAATIISPPA